MRGSSLAFVLFGAAACRAGGVSTTTSTSTAVSTATATSTARGDAAAGPCRADADCAAGRSCFFPEAGCATAGTCLVSDDPRACNKSIAMCSCTRHVTFYGSGGCAGSGVREPWELLACTCGADADCRGGQRCVPAMAGSSRPGAAGECRDPKP